MLVHDESPGVAAQRRFVIAVQPDYGGPTNSSSPRWMQLLTQAGHTVRQVNVLRPDILEQLEGVDGFMWRCAHVPSQIQIARRLFPVLERYLDIEVYPDEKTFWHFDDKVAQHYLLRALDIPTPRTWVWFDRDGALDWARTADYPLVLKLRSGAGSSNVRLVRSPAEARRWIARMFARGIRVLDEADRPLQDLKRRAKTKLRYWMRHGDANYMSIDLWERHKDYVMFQEFLPDNAFDTRITIIGNRAFAYRRFNRPNDFRASGSGRLDLERTKIAPQFVSLAFEVAKKLGMQSCAVDGLWRGEEPVVSEVCYTYVSSYINKLEGHWTPGLKWQEGQMWPEEAHVADFLERLRARDRRPAPHASVAV